MLDAATPMTGGTGLPAPGFPLLPPGTRDDAPLQASDNGL